MKTSLRIISLFMSVVCLFAFSLFEPTYSVAAQIQYNNETSEEIESSNAIWDDADSLEFEYSPLIGEITELRDEAVKQFRREDGAIELVMYSSPVHYEKDGKWEPINNTLIQSSNESGERIYTNTSSDFKVEFSTTENSIRIIYKGETLSIAQISEQEFAATVVDDVSTIMELTDEVDDALLRFPEELSSSISYSPYGTHAISEAEPIEYKLNGKSLSEFRTLMTRPVEALVYKYEIKTSLIPSIEENVVYLKNTAGENILVIDAPNMIDGNGAESFDFEVSITPDGDGYVYTVVPSYDWLRAPERVYPVVIDPDVKPEYDGVISDTIISKKNPDISYQYIPETYEKLDRIKINGSQEYEALIKIDELQPLSAGDVIINATLALSKYNSNNLGKEIDAYRVRKIWDEAGLTWNDFYETPDAIDTSRVESFVMSAENGDFNYLDITNLVKHWYAGTYSAYYTSEGNEEQYSILLKMANGC